jgi:hypothetical protein
MSCFSRANLDVIGCANRCVPVLSVLAARDCGTNWQNTQDLPDILLGGISVDSDEIASGGSPYRCDST